MIAQRFRAIGTVAMVATAATGLYLISLQVAAERGKLEAVESQIVRAKRDIRQLQTEFGTRASMRQLEQWNGEVLALSAPKAKQFVADGAQLAALDLSEAPGVANAPPVAMAAADVPNVPKADAAPKPVPTPKAKPAGPRGGEMRQANYVKPREDAPPKLQRVALVDADFSRELIRAAEAERRKRP